MKNIHLIPTYKPSRLHIAKNGDYHYSYENVLHLVSANDKPHNIYITNSEEIKEGEYGLSRLGEIIKFHSGYDYRYYAKIILTTDPTLIADGVQAITDEFLEWFVAHPSCERVEVSYGILKPFQSTDKGYMIHLPDNDVLEEPKQDTVGKEFYESADKVITVYRQETFEEAAEKWVFETNGHKWSNNDNTAGDNFASFIAGAKWQKEQDKSTDGEWLSPVPTERAWQEEKLVEIFGHYPTASPKWQYMNGLIQNSLDAKQMYSEQELRNAMDWMLTQYFEFHEWPAMGRVNHYIQTIKQQEQ
jgi:hypothetical protein